MAMEFDSALPLLVEESRELLQAMEQSLLAAEDGAIDADSINAMFRAAHTIKGSAGLFGLTNIVAFTHVVESVLERVRSNQLTLESDLISLMLSCRDHMQLLVDAAGQQEELAAPQHEQGEALLVRLQQYLDPVAAAPKTSTSSVVTETPTMRGAWHLSLRFGADVLRNGMDPASFIRYLATMGSISKLTTLTDSIPELENFNAESSYLGFELEFETDASREKIESVFEFVREDSKIRLLPPNSKIEEYVKLIQELDDDNNKLGEILVRSGVITETELNQALEAQRSAAPGESRVIGNILMETAGVSPDLIDAALDKQKRPEERRAQPEGRFVKTDAARLDKLVNLIGELVISSAASSLNAAQTKQVKVIESLEQLSALVEQIRDTTLTLRMVQIGESFQKFRRVVRDVSKELGKSIELVIEGGETELDRTMVEKLNDPLTHIVRNAMDHGIESMDIRQYNGKSPSGQLLLKAYHDAGSVVIEISDDGAGLNREKIKRKAIEKGLINADADLSDNEIEHLLFSPGFSTADKITNLSGRGVGMDVVKRNIDDLRGSIQISSVPGQGTTFSIRLPLTLAIIDGFQISVGAAQFVLPLNAVTECLDFKDVDRTDKRNFIALRGNVLPFVRLRDVFDLEAAEGQREKIVVVTYAGRHAGIVVDELHGELQAVIKPMGALFRGLRGIGGSTILGSGAVALIIDVAQLVDTAAQLETDERPSVNSLRHSRSVS